jgi:hypothetical protein
MLLYPVVNDASASSAGEVVVAFTLFAPRSAQPLNGQVVQFKAKVSSKAKAPIVERTDT